jgi:hypothetical protein
MLKSMRTRPPMRWLKRIEVARLLPGREVNRTRRAVSFRVMQQERGAIGGAIKFGFTGLQI